MTDIVLTSFLSIQMLNGCSGGINNSNRNASAANVAAANAAESKTNTAKDSAEELGLVVTLPFEPEEAAWKEVGQNEKKLTAVLRFSLENTKKLLAQIEKQKPAEPVTISSEPWFPAELIALGELNGDDYLKGLAYSAQDFILSPYTGGRIVRVENTEYFVLELFAR